jgi:hypothetical protein
MVSPVTQTAIVSTIVLSFSIWQLCQHCKAIHAWIITNPILFTVIIGVISKVLSSVQALASGVVILISSKLIFMHTVFIWYDINRDIGFVEPMVEMIRDKCILLNGIYQMDTWLKLGTVRGSFCKNQLHFAIYFGFPCMIKWTEDLSYRSAVTVYMPCIWYNQYFEKVAQYRSAQSAAVSEPLIIYNVGKKSQMSKRIRPSITESAIFNPGTLEHILHWIKESKRPMLLVLHGPPGNGKDLLTQILSIKLTPYYRIIELIGMREIMEMTFLCPEGEPTNIYLLKNIEEFTTSVTKTLHTMIVDADEKGELPILIVTVENIDKVKETIRLIRGGVMEYMEVKLGNASQYQLKHLFMRKYPNMSADTFLQTVQPGSISVNNIMRLIFDSESVEDLITSCNTWFTSNTSSH